MASDRMTLQDLIRYINSKTMQPASIKGQLIYKINIGKATLIYGGRYNHDSVAPKVSTFVDGLKDGWLIALVVDKIYLTSFGATWARGSDLPPSVTTMEELSKQHSAIFQQKFTKKYFALKPTRSTSGHNYDYNSTLKSALSAADPIKAVSMEAEAATLFEKFKVSSDDSADIIMGKTTINKVVDSYFNNHLLDLQRKRELWEALRQAVNQQLQNAGSDPVFQIMRACSACKSIDAKTVTVHLVNNGKTVAIKANPSVLGRQLLEYNHFDCFSFCNKAEYERACAAIGLNMTSRLSDMDPKYIGAITYGKKVLYQAK